MDGGGGNQRSNPVITWRIPPPWLSAQAAAPAQNSRISWWNGYSLTALI